MKRMISALIKKLCKVVWDVARNLAQAKDWAERVRTSLSAIESWSKNCDRNIDSVHLKHIDNFLKCDLVPCNEPGHRKPKEYAEAARLLAQIINEAQSLYALWLSWRACSTKLVASQSLSEEGRVCLFGQGVTRTALKKKGNNAATYIHKSS